MAWLQMLLRISFVLIVFIVVPSLSLSSAGLTCPARIEYHRFNLLSTTFFHFPKNPANPYHTRPERPSTTKNQKKIPKSAKKFSKTVEMIGIDSYNCYSDISIQSQTKYKPISSTWSFSFYPKRYQQISNLSQERR